MVLTKECATILVVFLMFAVCNSIYIPQDQTTHQRNLNNFGIKSLTWQGNESNNSNIQLHHNYSKVHHHSRPNGTVQIGTYSQRRNVNINDQLADFSQVNDNIDFSQSINDQIGFSASEKLVFGQLTVQAYRSCPVGATGLFVYEYSCSQFLNCWKGREHLQNCAPGTLFNPKTLECDYAEKVQCITGPNRISRDLQLNPKSVQASCPPKFSGLIPHYTVCTKYIQCHDGREIPMDCAPGTIFDVKTNTCDYPYKSECAVSSNDNEVYKSGYQKKKLVSIKPYHRNITYELNPNQIVDNSVYSGVDSSGRTYQILGKVKINDQLGEFTQNVQQTNNLRLLTQQEAYKLGFTQNPCFGSKSGIFEHPTNCSEFLQCFQGNLHLGICPHGTSYNPNTKACEYYNCHRLRSTGDQNSPKCPKGYSGLLPHPFDCKRFLNCDHGRTFIQDCGPGTVFNPKSSVCDWPHNVQCGSNEDRTGKIIDGANQDQNIDSSRFFGIDANRFCIGKQGFYQNLQNCTTFFNCRSGNLMIGVCHPGSQFNPFTNDCDNNYRCFLGNLRGSQSFERSRDQNHFPSQTQYSTIQRNRTQIGGFQQVEDQLTYESQTTVDQNLIGFEHVAKPVLSTDTNADYIFELDDLVEVEPDDGKQCNKDDFVCENGGCLKQSAVCDGVKDCANGEDEKNCGTYLTQFKQTKRTKMAVKEVAKFQNATTAFCAKMCIEGGDFKCKSFNYRKNDGMCFILDTNIGQTGSLFLLPNYDYYEYQKYSVDCTGKFTCSNQKCIENTRLCDGKFDCVDKEDEKDCDPKRIGYSVGLVGSNKTNEGTIQVKAFGKVGFVCDDQFGIKDAHVVCKELGFDQGALEVKGNSYFEVPDEFRNDPYMMDDVTCFGNETSLKDCNFNGWGVHNCKPKETVGVICKSSQAICPQDKWKCETTNECIPLDFLCDNVSDCTDKSDEGNQYCESPIEIRLVDGKRQTEGRLEIKYYGTWGTICDDDFNDDAAKVVCRYLGYQGPATAKKNGAYGAGKGPIWLDQVFCQGNESFIQECDHWDWGKHNCDHSEDVGIDCEDFKIQGTPRNIKISTLFPAKCGLRSDNMFSENSDVHFRVVKGSVAEKGQYPWQASIRVKGQSSQEHWCGAVVISDRFVLTAAHCLNGYQKGGFVIVAGDHDRNENEGTEQTANIEEFYLHPDFRKGTKMNNDLAVVKLKGSGFILGEHVQAICLPTSTFQEKGLNCTISGFGSIKSGKAVASRELRAGFVPIQSREVCTMPHIYGDALTEGMICAGALDGGTDACDGDSGGPLACLNDGVFTLVGLTSWGQHCGYANKPGVYVKVSHYRGWIDHIMKKHSASES